MLPDEIPAHELPGDIDLERPPTYCRFCSQAVRFGMTKPGKRGGKPKPAPFDADPPHRNHWITCLKRDEAREAFKR